MRLKRILYGWLTPAGFCLSHIPPDVPQFPRTVFASVAAAERHIAELNEGRMRRTVIVWSGSALAEKQKLDAQNLAIKKLDVLEQKVDLAADFDAREIA